MANSSYLSKGLSSTLGAKAKEKYELFSRELGIIVQSFLPDNASAFTSKEFSLQLAKFEQVIGFAGTGAHHHNAIAERNIQTILPTARHLGTM